MNANTAAGLDVDALVFDAYGTLFDVHSVEATAGRLFPGHGAALSQLWRTKQLEYTWLQSLMLSVHQRREDFAAITAHALDYAVEKLGLSLAASARHRRSTRTGSRAFPMPSPPRALAATHRAVQRNA
jgi:HAD superfamily hydrolase (TIGR01493 family)